MEDEPVPRISVVVPTFRRPDGLARIVAAFEAQDLPPSEWELLIVDNGSGDETTEVLEKLAASTTAPLRPLRVERNQGSAGGRNHGWRNARAPYVAFTDDDCMPDPAWLSTGLAVLERWPGVGVVQGRTEPPPDSPVGNWTLQRRVTGSTPWFEGCNLFFRREALVAAGGFDETIGHHGEDTAAGWDVLAQGWRREYTDDARVLHDNEERGWRWYVRWGVAERNLVALAARHPGLRRRGFWKPWAFRAQNVAVVVAVAGLATAAVRPRRCWPAAVLGFLPWAFLRRPFVTDPRRWRHAGELLLVDAAQTLGHVQGSIRNRIFVL